MSGVIDPERVAVYIRWSTDDQGDGTTLAVQGEACTAYLRSQGWQPRADLVFVDDGYSGGNLQRPALDRLRAAVREGLVDCVIVFKLDRLSRSVVDTVNLVLTEWEGRCHLKSAREPIDTSTPAGKMFFYLLASYAEWERSVIRERTSAGRLRRAHQGRWAAGPCPFGYRMGPDKQLVIDPAPATVVRGIFARYVQGHSIAEIVRQLQADGAPAPRGPGQWSKSLVRRILGNPVYAGVYQYGRRQANPRYGREAGAPRLLPAGEPLVRLAGAVPPVVPARTFAAVQRLRAQRDARRTRRSGQAQSSRWLLSGIARCGRCGSGLAVRAPRRGRSAYYFCLGRTNRLQCDCAQIQVHELDAWFAAQVTVKYAPALRGLRVDAAATSARQQRLAEVNAALAAERARAVRLDREWTVIRRRFRAAEITADEYRGFMAEVEADRQEVQARLPALAQEQAALRPEGGHHLLAELSDQDLWHRLVPQDRKRLALQLVESLQVYRPPGSGQVQVSVVWRQMISPAPPTGRISKRPVSG